MRILLLICVGLIACGAYVLLRHPNAAFVGIALIAIPGVIIIQAALIALANRVLPRDISPPEPPAPQDGFTELPGIPDAYRSFKVFLARSVGCIAIVYGLVTVNAYFIALGVAVVVLFWIWDRMIAAEPPTGEGMPDGETDVTTQSGQDRR